MPGCPAPAYSPDLTLHDSRIFPKFKMTEKGQHILNPFGSLGSHGDLGACADAGEGKAVRGPGEGEG